jgi:toxin ParE1/3/4
MRVVFSVRAEHDLEEIGDYIAAENPSRAVSFIQEIQEQCSKIAMSPLAYIARAELGKDIRSCVHGRYLIVFRPSDEDVLIVRILHGARNLARLF